MDNKSIARFFENVYGDFPNIHEKYAKAPEPLRPGLLMFLTWDQRFEN